ncbi:GNAT family N-acetyltransferase [Marinomonas sp. FW-1]|uniref:GNAT family N-acetyltransferase n=1 Tax=Marinomonas sp. FW-1 TaxID=2071621 RepID=UPI0010C03BD3|nr:GNAT family N-acetyltransferase [Marinomonas sp. FW-1]
MFVLREMLISDYDQVMALWGNTESMSLRGADSRDNIALYLKKNPGLSFVVEKQGLVVGAVLAGTDGRRGYLQHLAVSVSSRGEGLGKQLVNAVIAAFAEQGIAKTHLFVHSDNKAAQGFYESMGWFPRDEVRMFSFNSSSELNV